MDKCHVIHLGMGGSREKGHGVGCDCSVNILYLTRDLHDIMDRRKPDKRAERVFDEVYIFYSNRGYRKSQVYLLAFGLAYGYLNKIQKAIDHNRLRKQGKAKCCKWKS